MKQQTIPQLDIRDTAFTLGNVVSVSVRQFLLLIVGALVAINLFLLSAGLGIFQWVATAFPVLVAIVFGWVQVQQKPLELYLALIIRYLARPRVYVWRSVSEEGEVQGPAGKKSQAQAEPRPRGRVTIFRRKSAETPVSAR